LQRIANEKYGVKIQAVGNGFEEELKTLRRTGEDPMDKSTNEDYKICIVNEVVGPRL
jgi:hypothetical protein